MKLRQHPGMSSTRTSTAAQASESGPALGGGTPTDDTSCVMGVSERLAPEDNLLGFGLGPA
jgi:hypothetical protein